MVEGVGMAVWGTLECIRRMVIIDKAEKVSAIG